MVHPSTEATGDDAELTTTEVSRLVIVWIAPTTEFRTSALSDRDDLVIGRGDDCAIVLSGSSISRRHARLTRTGEHWFVRDLDSHNGVRQNGELVKKASITAGDVLRLGSWLGMVLRMGATEEPGYELYDDGFFGGPDLRELVVTADVAAKSDLCVTLEGATGTGKEQLARAIHRRSGRKGEFVAINCAMYQQNTAVAEIFGYRKGAFTGADRAHPGVIRAADGGTLLLDEITDLSLEVQAQLLRVIENGELLQMGESRPATVDVRFLAATQRSLGTMVEEGRFRADLRARLEGFRIRLPRLAERRGDIPFLFLHLLRQYSPAPPVPDVRVLERLCLYPWPLNVREMVAFVRRIVAAHPGAAELSLSHALRAFPELAGQTTDTQTPARAERRRRVDPRVFDPAEVAALKAALERHSGSIGKAAAELKMTRQRAYRMLKAGSR